MRTLLIGLDGASWGVLDRLFERGSAPTVRSIATEGVRAPLVSQVPPWTPSAWPSLYTGTNPGKHGVFDFLTYDGYEWDLANATSVREPSLWEVLDRRDRSSVVVNVPATHPSTSFDGALVPGYMAPAEPTCHPDGILEELRDELGEYEVYPQEDVTGAEGTDLDRRLDAVRSRRAAFDLLAGRVDPAFGFVEFQQTDSIIHARPGDWEALDAVYSCVDDQIDRLLDRWDPENVFLVSDHGTGPYAGYEFRVNEFLRREGWTETTTGGVGRPRWKSTLGGSDGADGGSLPGAAATDAVTALATRAAGLLARYDVTPQRVVPLLRKVGLNRVLGQIVPEEVVATTEASVDFPNSVAYARTRSECGVRLNVEGREPNGTVPREEYEAVREELVGLLSSATTPDGEPVFERVAPREEYFEGPHVERGPDVVTVPADFENLLSVAVGGDVFAGLSGRWNHKRDGIFAARGAAVDREDTLDRPHLFDVCPTVLATFGVPASERMDGEALDVVSPAGVASYPPYDPRRETATTDEGVERRLEDMGYLE
ncbi:MULTISPECIES: alkaline phosphatase family protein [Halorussus]|uniref:alkaline phosphatase family protein n=1 Tax=Halorussus TaxID=1070314 RepID=UPI000E216D5C|nr:MULTISPECIES: alkaline phosphatase family protein [Halorussus]NHN61413.1 phosphodiesterase [Halorussus sp. JP-T4]